MADPLDYLPGSRKVWLGALALAVAIAFGVWQVHTRARHASYLNRMLGCQKVEGVAESGFHFQEEFASKPFRWTNGQGKLLVPINRKRPPQGIWVCLEALRPQAMPVNLQIMLDGTAIFNGFVPPGNWEKTLDLTFHTFSDAAMIELRSATFVPGGTMNADRHPDRRVLGVQVKGIMLSRDDG